MSSAEEGSYATGEDDDAGSDRVGGGDGRPWWSWASVARDDDGEAC